VRRVAVDREPTYFGSFGEQVYGFAQAVRAGDTIYVAGQTAMSDDGSVEGDMAHQMAKAYEGVARALAPFGATLADVVDETLFVTDYMAAATVARDVRATVYGNTFPVASTLCAVASLGLPDLLIEIKCVAHR
jgi:enamine deaminase RidA (YjgF/YER057c/UK114 family)